MNRYVMNRYIPTMREVSKEYKKEWVANYKDIIKTMEKDHERSERSYKAILKGFRIDLKSLQEAKVV